MQDHSNLEPLQADIVLLVALSGTMQECIDALAENCSKFAPRLEVIFDRYTFAGWRYRVCGFHHRETHPQAWWIEHPFTNDTEILRSHIASLRGPGGGPEQKSLLDALYEIYCWPAAAVGEDPEANSWRHRDDASRHVFVFTDSGAELEFAFADGTKGALPDLISFLNSARIRTFLLAPERPEYVDLSMANGAIWQPVDDYRQLESEIRLSLSSGSLLQDVKRNLTIELTFSGVVL